MVNFTHEISLDEENHLIRLVVEGKLTKSEGEKIIIEARAVAAQNQYDILCDITKATILASMADWFYLFRNKEIYPSRSSEKTAILINPDTRKDYNFVKDVILNVRLKIRIFSNENDALKWLKTHGSKD
jgi:hypothetical protein